MAWPISKFVISTTFSSMLFVDVPSSMAYRLKKKHAARSLNLSKRGAKIFSGEQPQFDRRLANLATRASTAP